MTYKNDERIMELKKVIEDKRKELASNPQDLHLLLIAY